MDEFNIDEDLNMNQPELHRKVHEDSPNRCQSVMGSRGQCNNVKVSGCNFCHIHGGARVKNQQDKQDLKNYRLTKFKDRVDAFADNPQVKSLREEIGILRMMLENIIEKCQDEMDLLLQSDRISKLVNQVQLLVMACQKIEEKSGNLLEKTQLFIICESIVQIIGEHVSEPEVLDIISGKIVDTLTKSVTISVMG